jgi:toxin ParE1/3/4
MTHRILITPLANQDIDAHVNYLCVYNEKAAFRLFDSIRLTLTQIAKIPKIGVSYPLQNSRLAGLRKWPIKDFSNYIIFYLEKPEKIEVVRILHGARDVRFVLENDSSLD